MIILPIKNAESLRESIGDLASSWTESQEFWPIESCISTMRLSERFYSAVLKIQENACGWYLATKSGDTVELLFIFCAQHYRGRGVGKKLLQDLISRVEKDRQASEIFLEVRQSNLVAQKLYVNCGFTQVLTRQKYYKNGEDAVVYRRKIG